jgi:hypothetical protein
MLHHAAALFYNGTFFEVYDKDDSDKIKLRIKDSYQIKSGVTPFD